MITVAYVCVAIAAVMPLILTAISKAGVKFDNNKPRDWIETQTGYRKRAYWAHQNSFEAFPIFAAGVIIAQATGAMQARVDVLALAFIAVRVLYACLYIADIQSVRSIVWFLGYVISVGLIFAKLW